MKILSLSFATILCFLFCINVSAQPPEEEEIFMIVEESPRFPGCEDQTDKEERSECSTKKLLEYIYSNLSYPENARMNGIEGQVIIQFVVDKDGSLINFNLLRDLGGGCGDAAMKVVRSMNSMEEKWIPGKQRGRIVKVKYTLPIKFKLEDDKEATEDSPPSKDENIKKINAPNTDEILHKADEMPRFPGCESEKDTKKRRICTDKKMLNYLYRNLKYPQDARQNSIEGVAVIRFIVRKDGTLTDFEILKDPGGGCGEAALEVIKSMQDLPEKWIPAVQDGEKVDLKYTMPVKFKLG